MKIRKKLIQIRINKDLLQKDVAEAVDVTASYYGMIEQGKRNPNLEVAKKIADFFDTTVDDIFFENKNDNRLFGSAYGGCHG